MKALGREMLVLSGAPVSNRVAKSSNLAKFCEPGEAEGGVEAFCAISQSVLC